MPVFFDTARQVVQLSRNCLHAMKHGPPTANDARGLCYRHVDFPRTRCKRACDGVYAVRDGVLAALAATAFRRASVSHGVPRTAPPPPAPPRFWGKLCRDPELQDALLLAVLKTMLLVVCLVLLAACCCKTSRALRRRPVGPALKCFDFATADEETVRSLMHDLARWEGHAVSEDGPTDAPADTWCELLAGMSYSQVYAKRTRMQMQREYASRAFDWETAPRQHGCEFIF